MQVRGLTVLAAALAVAALGVRADIDDPKYYCTSDSYCEKNYPGTVCISVNSYGDVVSKCTPNTAKRPACRGAQPGLCPSYQTPDRGYLNAHCIFVDEDNVADLEGSSDTSDSSDTSSTKTTTKDSDSSDASESATASASTSAAASEASGEKSASAESASAAASATTSESGSGSARRRVLKVSATSDLESDSASASGSESKSSSKSSSKEFAATTSGSGADSYATVLIDDEEVRGKFMCVDLADCVNQAADPSTCQPTTCGSPDTLEVCTYHGTCTYKSIEKMSKRSCMCYAGFSGDKCEKEVSNACDVDCGMGADCEDGECVCKEGWDGKEYDGKQGKANARCTVCTNDLACQNGNACNVETGKCICNPGYSGETCGATEDSCTTRTDCGIGACQVLTNGSSACYCPICSPTCELCDMSINSSFDCSTCPSSSATVQFSNMLLFVSAVFTVVLTNFAL